VQMQMDTTGGAGGRPHTVDFTLLATPNSGLVTKAVFDWSGLVEYDRTSRSPAQT